MGGDKQNQSGNFSVFANSYKEQVKKQHSTYARKISESTPNGAIREKGEDQGVKINTFQAPPPAKEKKKLDIIVGMFFDGTGNNRFNSDANYYGKYVHSNNTTIKADTIPAKTKVKQYIIDDDGKEKEVEVEITDTSSFWNPYSNIVLLHDLYQQDEQIVRDTPTHLHIKLRQYVQGIGTRKGKDDDTLGSAFGEGSDGIIGKVEEGCKLLCQQLKNTHAFSKEYEIASLTFDVFGFSRGAAAARHFCNDVLAKQTYLVLMDEDTSKTPPNSEKQPGLPPPPRMPKDFYNGGFLGSLFKKEKNVFPQQVRVRFLGLFDTVISQFIVKKHWGYKAGAVATTYPVLGPVVGASLAVTEKSLDRVKQKTNLPEIQHVFHITANDEWRENFALTPVTSGYSLSMLGAHSDIGGGYASVDKCTDILTFFDVPVKDGHNGVVPDTIVKLRQKFIDDKYCQPNEIRFRDMYDHVRQVITTDGLPGIINTEQPNEFLGNKMSKFENNFGSSTFSEKTADHYILEASRVLDNKLPLAAMYAMHKVARSHDVPFAKDPNSMGVPHSFEYTVPSDLQDYVTYMQQVAAIIDNNEQEKHPDIFQKNTNGQWIYQLTPAMFQLVRNKYTHFSSNYNTAKLTSAHGDHVITDMLYVNQPRENMQREIYNYNK